MEPELIQESIDRLNQLLELKHNRIKKTVYEVELTKSFLSQKQDELAQKLLNEELFDPNAFSCGAFISYGYRMGAALLKGEVTCCTRQNGYEDSAVLSYSAGDLLNEEEETEEISGGNLLEWTLNPGSNVEILDIILERMIVPQIKQLCRISPPGKKMECIVAMPPISKDFTDPDWQTVMSTLRANNIGIHIVSYGDLFDLGENERLYLVQSYCDEIREYIIVSAYERNRGKNMLMRSIAFDQNSWKTLYELQDLKNIDFTVDNRRKKYEQVSQEQESNDLQFVDNIFPVIPGFNSFLGSHETSFPNCQYKINNECKDYNHDVQIIEKVFKGQEVLQPIDVCARLTGRDNLYNISLSDLVYIAALLEKSNRFLPVSLKTKKDYKLGTTTRFNSKINVAHLPTLPANYATISWKIKDKSIKIEPYFQLNADNSDKQIIESIIDYYDHCTTEQVADDLLYIFRNKEDPSAFFTAKIYLYLAGMKSIEVESRNEIISSFENVDEVQYKEIDKSTIPMANYSKPKSEKENKILSMVIEELDLTVRSYNCLKRAGIHTVKDITKRSVSDLMKIRNLGKSSQIEIVNKLEQLGIHLPD